MNLAHAFRANLSKLQNRPPCCFPSDRVPAHFRRSAVLLPFWVVHNGVRYGNQTRSWRGESAYGLSAARPSKAHLDDLRTYLAQ